MNNTSLVELELNNNPDLDFFTKFKQNPDIVPFVEYSLDCKYYDENCFISEYKNNGNQIVLSINIQSLASKFDELLNIIDKFESKGVNIAIIALQEVWLIPENSHFYIKGFNFVSKTRQKGRGGGVAFFYH